MEGRKSRLAVKILAIVLAALFIIGVFIGVISLIISA